MKKNIISIINENNNLEKVEIIKYFTLKTNNKDYLFYKNPGLKKSLIYTAEIEEKDDSIYLKPVEDKRILDELKNIMECIKNG